MEYLFKIVNESGSNMGVDSGVFNPIGSDVNDNTQTGGSSFFEGMTARAEKKLFQQFALSPLNQATGGLATPAFNLGKGIVGGAGGAVIGGAAAMAAVAAIQLIVNKVQERMAKMEAKAAAANERDNALLRAGTKDFITLYERESFKITKTISRG